MDTRAEGIPLYRRDATPSLQHAYGASGDFLAGLSRASDDLQIDFRRFLCCAALATGRCHRRVFSSKVLANHVSVEGVSGLANQVSPIKVANDTP